MNFSEGGHGSGAWFAYARNKSDAVTRTRAPRRVGELGVDQFNVGT